MSSICLHFLTRGANIMNSWHEIVYLSLLPIGLVFGYIAGKMHKKVTKNKGEALVRQVLAKYCRNRDAHLLSNITLRLNDGSTTQVDSILVSTKGVFVVEVKHYKGWVFANSQSKVWTQTLFHMKFRFQNPINQNYKHVKAVQAYLDFLEPKLIYNIVVFSGKAIFKTPVPNNVCSVKELIHTIEQHLDGALSLNRVQFCVGRLEYTRLELTRETDIEHQAYLMRRFGQ